MAIQYMYQIPIKFTYIFHCKTVQNLPNCLFENGSVWIFGLKIYHLATLVLRFYVHKTVQIDEDGVTTVVHTFFSLSRKFQSYFKGLFTNYTNYEILVARHRATQLGLILPLVARCRATLRNKNFIVCVNGP
jgi:hypothetical protein